MSEPVPSKIRRLSELPRDIPPPRDGWPALEAMLRESGMRPPAAGREQGEEAKPARRWRLRTTQIATLAAVLAAVVVGISIDRWMLPAAPAGSVAAHPDAGSAESGMRVAYVTDPRYLHERAELLRSLDARLAKLPPATRRKVLQSLATIHQSMQQVQEALGREPGNVLLQEMLIDTYQDEMQVLATVQEASGGSGET